MAKREPAPEEKGDPNAWMSTFSDLLMLMLTFFVLLLTMSSMDDKDVKQLMRQGIHIAPSDDKDSMVANQIKIDRSKVEASVVQLQKALQQPLTPDHMRQVGKLLKELLTAAGVSGSSWVDIRPEGLVVSIDGEIGFEPGTAKMTEPANVLVEELAQTLGPAGLNVTVEACCSQGATYGEWEDAWELALMRADVVANAFIRKSVAPERLRIMGYGFAEGTESNRFYRKAQLLRIHIITGESGAEPVAD
jgi:chemotaxis protein MotB